MRTVTVILLALAAAASSQAAEKKFLESYTGQSTGQLIALAADHRVDSLVLAFEQAIEQKRAKKKLSQPEADILAVEAVEREVNNGGYHQFFVNSSKEHAATLPAALERIGCPVAAKIATDAIASLKITGAVTEAKIDGAMARLGDKASASFGKMDERYFANKEPIADQLFAYIQAKKAEIVLK